MLYKIIDSWNAPYTFSAMAQVIGAILAITLTFRIILSQRLKYRFPLKISGRLSKFEIVYFFSGVILALLSLVFLMVHYIIALPFVLTATIFWMFMLYVYYRATASSLSLENLLEMAKQKDKESLRIWGEKHHGIISKRPKLVLYDISTQAVGQKDFQYMEDALAYLASLSDRFAAFIIRSNIGVLIRQYIDNSRVFESCLDIYYLLISPTAVGIKAKTYFFDEMKEKVEYNTPEMYVDNIIFRESMLFSDKNCSQVTMDLEELSKRYVPLFSHREKRYILRDILSIILSAMVDFECLGIVMSKKEQKPSNSCKKNLTDFLIKLSELFRREIEVPFIEVIKDLSTSLSATIITNAYPDTKGREFWQKAGEYESGIRQKAAKSLAALLRGELMPKFNDPKFFDMIEHYLTTTQWMSEE